MMYCKIYYTKNIQNGDKTLFMYTLYKMILIKIAWQHPDMQIMQCYECKWGMFMNTYEEIIAGNADDNASYPDAS